MNEGNKVRLGLIGFSPGNGHPYSWSAICNGYNSMLMEDCGFPVIPRYLEKQSFPEDSIKSAQVTHIWTQDEGLSAHIARATNIQFLVDDFKDMIGEVDGILLARDDAENHLFFAAPFLDAGLPIYIDKPLALTVEDAREILDRQVFPGQIFSCSALRYAREFTISAAQYKKLGKVKFIVGSTPKDWDKYSIHVIEPLLRLFPEVSASSGKKFCWSSSNRVVLHGECESGLEYEISAFGSCSIPISLKIIGENDSIDLVFNDAFHAFKSAIELFVVETCQGRVALPVDEMLASISFVESGRV